MEPAQFDTILNTYIEEQVPATNTDGFAGKLSEIKHNMTSREQFEMFSTISNYHVLGFPSKKDPKKEIIPMISLYEHVATPEQKRYVPASPRNRIIHFVKSGELENLQHYIRFLMQKDKAPYYSTPLEPPPKKQRLTTRAKRVDAFRLKQKFLSPDLVELINRSNIDRTVYTTFKNQLLTSGMIKWRYNENGRNVCAMNDYSINGHLVPNSFVHVSSEPSGDGTHIIRCSCQIYHFLQNVEIGHESEISPETSCMHCRFYNDHLIDAYDVINQGSSNINRPLQMVKSSIEYMNDPVLLLGDILPLSTTKYSVKGDDYFSIVTINFHGGTCYIKCHSGFCLAANINKKRIPRSGKLSDTAKLCSHLNTCYTHIDRIMSSFPNYFCDSESSDDVNDNRDTDEYINTEDDASINTYLVSNFDKSTGLWSYRSESTHKPMFGDNKKLHLFTRERIKYVVNYNINESINLKQNVTNVDGTPRKCDCGSIYTENSHFEEGNCNLYTRVGLAHIKYYGIRCQNNTCEKSFYEIAPTMGLFFYSKTTCAGDEIGWDFINAVKTSKISFTGFCSHMTRMYETTNSGSEPFMSRKTFISWFFGWLSAFRIDFRKEIDPYCGHDPKILACDGTHIGVALRHLRLDNPVTKPDTENEVPWVHGRVTRRLFQDNIVRQHVKYMALKYLNRITTETMSQLDENQFSLDAQEKISNEKPLKDFLQQFLFPSVEPEVLKVQAELLLQLSGEYQIESVIPFRSFDILLTICSKLEQNEDCTNEAIQMRKYNTQVCDMVLLSVKNGCTETLSPFFRYLIEKINGIHYGDPHPTAIEEIDKSYDPRSGTAYYFTQSGNQVRKMPHYEKNKIKKRNEQSSDKECQKKYPTVSQGGYSYLFLMFCPLHGHSYGFHLIDGAEGPKDVFSSLLKYKPEMPLELFYDNACHLSEYCLNREPDLFKNTRFWHDLFHAIAHICGINFKSTRVEGLGGINTEICEQVNSYLQSIKYTGAHLSQEHFVFFLQFFLYLLNKDKTQRQGELAKMALQGMD